MMDNAEQKKLRRNAGLAFKNHDFELAFSISEQLAKENDPSAFFTCGLILENGWLQGKKDLDRALSFYRKLAINWNDDEGYLGCVRIILSKRQNDQRDQAIQYCFDATKGPSKCWAFILMGRIYEELYDPPKFRLARKAYLKAFSLGSAWALRKYAESLMKSRNFVGGVSMHVVATIVSPFMTLLGGMKVTRHG